VRATTILVHLVYDHATNVEGLYIHLDCTLGRAVLPAEGSSGQPPMSDRAQEFLDYLESEHVEAVPSAGS
jgi:hypothetical protein